LPATHESVLEYVLDRVDLILVMTVNPGFGGQAFIPLQLEKIRTVCATIGARPIRLQIDGGVTADNAGEIARDGANTLVAGSAVFKAASRSTIAPISLRFALRRRPLK
jgi:ribulose-phosphate 3-epimerase